MRLPEEQALLHQAEDSGVQQGPGRKQLIPAVQALSSTPGIHIKKKKGC